MACTKVSGWWKSMKLQKKVVGTKDRKAKNRKEEPRVQAGADRKSLTKEMIQVNGTKGKLKASKEVQRMQAGADQQSRFKALNQMRAEEKDMKKEKDQGIFLGGTTKDSTQLSTQSPYREPQHSHQSPLLLRGKEKQQQPKWRPLSATKESSSSNIYYQSKLLTSKSIKEWHMVQLHIKRTTGKKIKSA